MRNLALLLILMSNYCSASVSRTFKAADTTIVGKVLQMDSVLLDMPLTHGVDRYYFDIFHLRIQLLNEKKEPIDTVVIGLVFNKLMEKETYFRNFNFINGTTYIFKLTPLSPCKCIYPKMAGSCKDGLFIPNSSHVIKSYKEIFQIIYYTELN